MTIDLKKEAEAVRDYAIRLRRTFHQYPEPSMEEVKTSSIIKAELEALGIPYKTLEPTGILAYIGKEDGPCIGLRADMDALRIEEQNEVSYRSKNVGIMHACGHDGHMAALMGATRILKKYENSLSGMVRLLFQPSEENCKGAKLMIKGGAIEGMDSIFGLHVFTDIPCGQISIETGPRMARTDNFQIEVTGVSGHAGKPHQCVDAALTGAAILMNLQSVISRQTNPVDSAVLTVGKFLAGTQYNVIAGSAQMEGTVRTFDDATAARIEADIKRIAKATAEAYRASAKVKYLPSEHPPVVNDANAVALALKGAKMCFLEEQLVTIPKIMLGEDFSIYQQHLSGAFAFVGGGNKEKGLIYPNHHACFDMDEEAVIDGVKLYAAYAFAALLKGEQHV